ncbi:MAG TPA: hypothetical protein VFB85_07450 [Vicinamibacterales bacterium]|jgi:hypothetical protein|nr:hypothetical protein [Vicinamibacterales bacterium]
MTSACRFVCALLFLLVATPSIANASGPLRDGLRSRIRTTDARLRRLLDHGLRLSPTFRALVQRLLESDVVVYLWCDGVHERVTDGRLTFVSAAGGLRYVVVRLLPLASAQRQIAIMAHELRHAVEIADAPDVVDQESLAREYQRIGYSNSTPLSSKIAYDSSAAIAAGIAVLRELTDGDEY